MIIYCKNDGHTESIPSSIPFGYSEDVVIYIPKVAHSLELRVKPPSGEYLQPIVASKVGINTSEEETFFVLTLPPEVTATLSGRADYQVVAYTPKGEMPFQTGSFNIQKGVPVEIPKTLDELKAYNLERLHQMLAGVGLNLEEIGGFVGTKQNLDTNAKTVVGAINELRAMGGGGGGGAPVDKDLVLDGFAADAKVVGDKFKEVNDTLGNINLQVLQNDEDIEELIERVGSLELGNRGIDNIALIESTTDNEGRIVKKYRITFTDGDFFDFGVTDGKDGKRGEDGKGFSIARTYQSIEQMYASHSDSSVAVGDFVLIANDNVDDDPDNAKLFVKTENGYTYLTDLSGAQGIKGVGVKSFKATSQYTENGRTVREYTMEFTDGDSTVIKVTDGKDGTPAVHGWNGTILTITSASGTSSADLKGDPGDTGVGVNFIALNEDKSYTDEEGRKIDVYDLHLTNGAIYELKVPNGKDGGGGDALSGEVVIQDGSICGAVSEAVEEYRKGKNLFFETPVGFNNYEKSALIGIDQERSILYFINIYYSNIIEVDYSGIESNDATVTFKKFIVELDDTFQEYNMAARSSAVGSALSVIDGRITTLGEKDQQIEQEVSKHANDIADLADRCGSLEDFDKGIYDVLNDHTGRIEALESGGGSSSELADRVDSLEGEVEEIGDAVANQGALIAELSRTSKEYTDGKVAEIVNSAPETLNTLNELADALGKDPNFATSVSTEIGKKVDKTDIVNNLVSSDATKPLSAAQGKALKALIDNINTSGGGGGGSTSVSFLSHDSTGTEFNDAVRDYQYYKTPIMFLDGVDSCPMVTFTSSENTAPICYFLNGRTKQILEVLNGGYNVRVYITDLKYTVRAVFTEEEMDNVLNNAKDDNEGEVYQYIGGGGKYAMGSIYMVTRE